MCEFGIKIVAKRAFNPKWFTKWLWLHYNSSHDQEYCFTATANGKLSLQSGNVKESAFATTGYTNCKDATVAFGAHEKSNVHKRAVKVMIYLPETTKDIGELLSTAHTEEKQRRQCL